MKSICEYLVPLEISHICHQAGASEFCKHNPYGVTDLSLATLVCTECCLKDGTVSMEDIMTKQIDPMNFVNCFERADVYSMPYKNKMYLRRIGVLPKHEVNDVVGRTGVYQRVECFMRSGSGAVLDGICPICKLSVSE